MINYTYSQEQINTVIECLDKISVTGINNTLILATIINIVNKPVDVKTENKTEE